MPKCSKCGKRFDSLSALQDHYKAVHPNQRFVPPKTSTARNFTVILVIGIIAVASVSGYLVYGQLNQKTNTVQTSLLGTVIPPDLMNNLTGVSYSTLNAVGSGQGVTPPSIISGTALTSGGKPVMLYIGGEFCPYCAVQRWGMIVALAKFGNFSGIEYMQSSSSDIYPNTFTFSFHQSTYNSPYVVFAPYEAYDRSDNPQSPSPAANYAALQQQYDPSGGIPFVDIANKFAVDTSSQISPTVLSKFDNWTQIASQLNNASAPVAKAIDGEANTLITAICKVDGGKPTSLCSQSFANLPFASSSSSSTAGIIQIPLQITTANYPEQLISRYAARSIS